MANLFACLPSKMTLVDLEPRKFLLYDEIRFFGESVGSSGGSSGGNVEVEEVRGPVMSLVCNYAINHFHFMMKSATAYVTPPPTAAPTTALISVLTPPHSPLDPLTVRTGRLVAALPYIDPTTRFICYDTPSMHDLCGLLG